MNRYPPTTPLPPVESLHRRAAVAVALTVLSLGCDARPPGPATSSTVAATVAPSSPAAPSTAGLLVADGGPIRISDGNGRLVDFAGPSEPVERLSAAGGTVVAVTAGGVLYQSRPGAAGSQGEWRAITAAIGPVGRIRLPAVGPSGSELAVATGELQAASFDLVIVDLATDTSRAIHIDRGLDGAPSWLGPRRIGIEAIRPNGGAMLVVIDPASGALSDLAIMGTAISATPDGALLAVDDSATGDVLVGGTDPTGVGWAPGEPSRIAGSDAAGVEGLALSAAGRRLAVVRRIGDQAATLVILASGGRGWEAIGSFEIRGDHAVSIAWLG